MAAQYGILGVRDPLNMYSILILNQRKQTSLYEAIMH